ncbi:hypothetical protein M378DRAFT_179309 [Amanita muscaria Koide BX008]|uniref:Tyr recombinase domain-containing protein n=1 Tax=Amanita muscaria (strain Koide BX008) TaxID=946122 RepID=A0A0C2X3P2_AMAMK|nr:hypothetical protein M378DRAFT_179309 [Amanita muscaria Koide BX008]
MTDIANLVDNLYNRRKVRQVQDTRGDSRTTDTSDLPQVDPIPAVVANTLANAWAPATRIRYDANVKGFFTFCDKQKVAIHDRLPAGEMLLATFVAMLAGTCSGATIHNKIHAIRAWHIQQNQPWRAGTLLNYVLKGAERATPEKSKQARRPPVTIHMLQELHLGLDKDDPQDVAVYAAATITFYGQLRLGELCTKWEAYSTFNNRTHSTRQDLKGPHSRAGSRILVIPWTKVKRTRGEEVAICRQTGITDPIAALERDLQVNSITSADLALMSYVTSSGQRKLLTISKFMKRCNAIWARHNHPRFTGHCFRIGGTTYYLLRKVDPDIVRTLGRWSSSAFLRYWRQLDVLATIHTELLQLKPRQAARVVAALDTELDGG